MESEIINDKLKLALEQMQEGEMYSVKEFASLCNVTQGTVYNWIYLGRCSYLKIGRSIRFEREQLSKHLEQSMHSLVAPKDKPTYSVQMKDKVKSLRFISLKLMNMLEILEGGGRNLDIPSLEQSLEQALSKTNSLIIDTLQSKVKSKRE